MLWMIGLARGSKLRCADNPVELTLGAEMVGRAGEVVGSGLGMALGGEGAGAAGGGAADVSGVEGTGAGAAAGAGAEAGEPRDSVLTAGIGDAGVLVWIVGRGERVRAVGSLPALATASRTFFSPSGERNAELSLIAGSNTGELSQCGRVLAGEPSAARFPASVNFSAGDLDR